MCKLKNNYRPRHRQAIGFSLIEILIATAIMALMFVVSLNSFSGIRKALGTTENKDIVFREAENIHHLLKNDIIQNIEKDYPLWTVTELPSNGGNNHLKTYRILHKHEKNIQFIIEKFSYNDNQ